jgi:histidinol-phosphatase
MSSHRLLDDVAATVRIAGDIALAHFGKSIVATVKTDGSPVTIADRLAEEGARSHILTHYPSDGVVGEEFGEIPGTTGRRWFVDPIDGTRTFIRGVPLWGSLVGVSEGDRVVAGAIYCPAAGLLIAAADGLGCWCNGSLCRVSEVARVEDSLILCTSDAFRDPLRKARWSALAGRAGMVRTWGDCYGYALVASGQAELMVDDRLAPWDAAPMLPILREAGGVYTDWTGAHSLTGADGIASNWRLHDEFRHALDVPLKPPGGAELSATTPP